MGHALGGENTVRVFTTQERWNALAHGNSPSADFKPEIIVEKSGVVAIDPTDDAAVAAINTRPGACLVTVADGTDMDVIAAFRLLAARLDARHPILLKDMLADARADADPLGAQLAAARNLGSLLCDGIGDAVLVRGETRRPASRCAWPTTSCRRRARGFSRPITSPARVAAARSSTCKPRRARSARPPATSRACASPSWAASSTARAKWPTRISVMSAAHRTKSTSTCGKTAVKFNIPEDEAVERLIELIREHGKWVDAPIAANRFR